MITGGCDFCRVCGFSLGYSPWGENNDAPDYGICDCCGVEFGYEDGSLTSVRAYRDKWLAGGAEWFDAKTKPANWEVSRQMERIPPDYL